MATAARRVAREIVIAARPHFFALPVLAARAGIAATRPSHWIRPVASLLVVALGWGAAQLVNDLRDQETDRVTAPNRAIVSGRLPARWAWIAAAVAGSGLLAATIALHPCGWALGLSGALLVLLYNLAKRHPAGGNVALGLLFALTAAIGIAASMPLPEASLRAATESLVRAVYRARTTLAACFAVAAWYLQANYEKDRRGDEIAGYRTIAVLAGVRASAMLRAVGIMAIGAFAWAVGLLPTPLGLSMMAASGVIGLYSTLRPLVSATDDAALRAYRPGVVATLLAMGSLSASVDPWLSATLVLVALAGTEAAFRSTPNP